MPQTDFSVSLAPLSVGKTLTCGLISPWTSYQIRKTAGAHAPGMLKTFSPPPWVSDPDMHHGMCVTHVPWCTPGSLTSSFLWSRRWGKTFPALAAHAQPPILRIWQEAHGGKVSWLCRPAPWTNQMYRHVLQQSLLPWARATFQNNLVLVQDNAPHHTAWTTMDFLGKEDVEVIDWPFKVPI